MTIHSRIPNLHQELVEAWLDKTAQSMTGRLSRFRKSELILKYNCLKERAIELKVWKSYCDQRELGDSHDGADRIC